MEREVAVSDITERFRQSVAETAAFRSALLLVHAENRDVRLSVAAGEVEGTPVEPQQPFFPASVGKTFTATLVAMLVEDGDLRFDDPISPYLSEERRDVLHVYRGTDYTDDILVRHLLAHTSGLPHLLGDEYGLFSRRKERSAEGETFFDVITGDPTRFWEPEATITWAKENLRPHFPPGDGIFYSDVGYNLLGLIVERLTGGPFHRALHGYLFEPLAMEHSYLAHFSEPAVRSDRTVLPIYQGDRRFDIEQYRSFSGWYAGGQTVNTTEDLLTFHRALVGGRLVTAETLAEMTRWRNLTLGVDYGYGVARIRPMYLRSRYDAWGGLGATNAVMLYNPGNDIYVVSTFNQTESRQKAMRFVFGTLRTVSKVERREE
jgi:CubicO group peptidase (beta-lactamase class C family)